MRVADRPLPTFAPSDAPTFVSWPVSLHVVLEQTSTPLRWDEPDVLWDDPRAEWDEDQLAAEFLDIACDLAGADITHGPPDELQLMPTGSLLLTLDNRSGDYTRYNPDGTLDNTQLGKRVGLVVHSANHAGLGTDTSWWLFYGRVAAWVEQDNDTVEVTAFNVVNDMTPQAPFTPSGTTVATRVPAVMTAGNVVDGFTRLAAGTVALTVQATERSPWEELQSVALSDGGVMFADADDAVVYLGRDWRAGRTDQTKVWTLTDNACDDAEVVVWNAELSTNDEELITGVHLTNVAGLVADDELSPNPYNTDSIRKHPDPDQWTTQAEGDALAAYLLAEWSVSMVKLASFQIMVDDPRFDLWQLGVDTRIGDRFAFVHDYKPAGQFIVGGIVNHVAHSITPEQWVLTLAAWAFPFEAPAVWDEGAWGSSRWEGPA